MRSACLTTVAEGAYRRGLKRPKSKSGAGEGTHGPEYQALCRVHLSARITAYSRAAVEQVPPTTAPSRRERKRPQRIASPASKPVLRPTPTPVNVSLGAIAHSAPSPTVLRTHLFSVAWLLRNPAGGRWRHSVDSGQRSRPAPLAGIPQPPSTALGKNSHVLRTSTN